MNCRICGGGTEKQFSATVLHKYDASFFLCGTCRFLQSEDPFWLDEAYQEAITSTDTGIVARNISLSRLATVVQRLFMGKDSKSLDYAGGYGLLTRMMRDAGLDSYWHDPRAKNLFSRGYEYSEAVGPVDLVTCFEAFEHFVEPLSEIDKMLTFSSNILFTIDLLPRPVPETGNWWYFGFHCGQHISFYSHETLKFIAERYRLNLYTNGTNVHMFSRARYPRGILRYLLALNRAGLWLLVERTLKSKTLDDMNRLIRSGRTL